MRSYSSFHQSIGEEKFRDWSASPGVGGGGGSGAGRGVVAAGGYCDIWLSKKKRNGLGCLSYATTAKFPEASSRSSRKMNGGRYKGVLLLLSLKKRGKKNNTRIHIQRTLLTSCTLNNHNIECPTDISRLPTQLPSKLTLRHLALYVIPQHSLTILEIYGGTAPGLEALLKTCHHIQIYTWADTDPDAYTAIQHRLAQLHHQHPTQLPVTVINQWDNLLPLEPTLNTPNSIATNFSRNIDIIIARLPTFTSTKK